ncbi:adenylate/guanylate cyclase domain-containing protein [Sulfurimonas microaerophilic]|uniref:adenylate/guanylate cyclase domain-containing protein n=1 Tax=Sulfurimonas microaerophilic TaxID=3058392 RepID=UPI00271496D5|nr:adenylate/guanylate cyclase domain-containing protein [Sulfurimonas sp. hsl 1-7]
MRFSVVAFLTVLFVLFLQFEKIELLESFAQRFNDINFQLTQKKINPDVVVVAIDEKSVNHFGRWPWDRAVLAEGIVKLQDADVLALDMVFSEPTPSDEKFSEVLGSLDNSICGFFLRTNATQELGEAQLDILQNSSLDLLQTKMKEGNKFLKADYAELNVEPILDSCTLQGAFSTLSSSDKLYRFYPTAFYLHNSLYPSLGLQSLRLKFNRDVDRKNANTLLLNQLSIPINEHGFTRLNFYKKNEYKTISFLDLYNGDVKSSELKEKIVLFGVTEMGIGDVVPTPIGNLYGVYIHYTFLSNFLNNELIFEAQWLNLVFTATIMLLVLLYILYMKKVFSRVVAYVLSYAVLFITAKALFINYSIYIDTFYPLLALILSAFIQEFILFYIHEKDARFIKKAFSSYLSRELLNKLANSEKSLELGGEKKELSILFSDIRNFTTISEEMNDPQKLIHLLNRYFTPMTQAVMDNKGMLDKYIGDAVMAFFNAPVDVENHAEAACRCALDMREKLARLNEELEGDGIAPIHIGVGINTGEAVVGNMGATKRFNYTIIGDSVNLASRLESKTKEFGVDIIISSYTYEFVKDLFICKDLGYTAIKGKKDEVKIYQLVSDKNDIITAKVE